MFLLAHLSDPHVASRLRLGWRDVAGKRLLGFLSWQLRRRHIHRVGVLDALADDLRQQGPDHVVVTGDITNVSLPAEFTTAAAWLARLGQPERVSIIPGNHDAYVAVSWERSWAHWDAYMRSDAASETEPRSGLGTFPYLRRRGELAILGLSTAVATGPGLALGQLGADQLRLAGALLDRLREEGAFRVVLLHHPPDAAPGHRHKRLIDAPAFKAMLAETGAELVLHGHDHVHRLRTLPSRRGDIPAIGAASASALPVHGHPPAQYNLLRIDRSDDGWTVELRVRGLDATRRFVELQGAHLTLPRAHAPFSDRDTISRADAGTVAP